jgi:hypothetical protein
VAKFDVVIMIIAWSRSAGELGEHSAKKGKKGGSVSSKAPGHITDQQHWEQYSSTVL